MDPTGDVVAYARMRAKEIGFPGNDSAALGVLAEVIERERDEHKRYVNRIDALENDDYQLEFIAQEVRASTTETPEDRDELVEFLQAMIKKLKKLEYDETPDEPIGDYNDMAYELEKEQRLGWA